MTGNTWDIIKIQTKTNQLMMGNRKDHIRVRGQRQRKTKSDTYIVAIAIPNSSVFFYVKTAVFILNICPFPGATFCARAPSGAGAILGFF